MIGRTLVLFVASSALSIALACGGGPCGSCDAAAKTASASDLASVDGQSVKLAATGVNCGGSAASFHAALMKIDGVKAAKVETDGKTELKFDAAKTDVSKIIAAVAKTGAFTAKKVDEA
jgi:copper chaperone CopZ